MRSEVDASSTCGRCGATYAAQSAPSGLCPRCLLAFGREQIPDPSVPAPAVGNRGPDLPAIPGYEITGVVGAGGSGVVFRAARRDDETRQPVALKVLAASGEASARRFVREVGALHRLDHPGIVSVFEVGSDARHQWVAMEYVEGLDLRKLLRTGPLSQTQAIRITHELCDALAAAHQKGIVHRDVKPENVLIDRTGRVKVVDFGLVRFESASGSDDARLTRTDMALGTPVYMAPEQIESPCDVDERADVYALGVLLYEMLTGELPLGRFDPPSRSAPIDRRLDAIVLKALAKRPSERFASTLELKRALNHALETADPVLGAGRRLRRLRTRRRGPGWVRRLPVLLAVAWFVAAVLLFARLEPFDPALVVSQVAVAGWLLLALSSPRLRDARPRPETILACAVPMIAYLLQVGAPELVLAWLQRLTGEGSAAGALSALRVAGGIGAVVGSIGFVGARA